MEKEEILLTATDTILNFPKKINPPIILFLSKQRFSKYLDFMKLTKHLSKTPCFIAEMKGGSIIYFCPEIINSLIKEKHLNKKQFIKAITIHELYHAYNHIAVNTQEAALFSEALVHKEMKENFPKEYNLISKHF